MTLVQWQADDSQRRNDERAESLYRKLDALTDLDRSLPRFISTVR